MLVAAGKRAVLQMLSPYPVFSFYPITMLFITGYQLLVNGRLANLTNPIPTPFYTGIIGSLLLLPMMVFQGDAFFPVLAGLSSTKLFLLAVIGILGTVGHLLLIMAFSRSSTAAIMPFTYSQIGFAVLVGWAIFGDMPDAWAWVGMVIIAICGIITAILNDISRRLMIRSTSKLDW